MKVKLEAFLKCCVVKSESAENLECEFRVLFEIPISVGALVTKQVIFYTKDWNVLGDSLCKVRVMAMNQKRALVRLPNYPTEYKKREFWIPREQIEWH